MNPPIANHPFLKRAGLNMAAVFDCNDLPAKASEVVATLPAVHRDLPQLILLGAYGRRMWQAMTEGGWVGDNDGHDHGRDDGHDHDDNDNDARGKNKGRVYCEDAHRRVNPVDNYSMHIARCFIAEYLPAYSPAHLPARLPEHSPAQYPKHVHDQRAPRVHFLYPGDFPLPLQALGEALGWSHPSPLGLGIHPEYGLWFAWRAAFLADTHLAITSRIAWPSPCLNCVGTPCIATCPAQAVHAPHTGEKFNVRACTNHRLAPNSSCAETCLARLACPVGALHRYSPAQFAHHARCALPVMQKYSEECKA